MGKRNKSNLVLRGTASVSGHFCLLLLLLDLYVQKAMHRR